MSKNSVQCFGGNFAEFEFIKTQVECFSYGYTIKIGILSKTVTLTTWCYSIKTMYCRVKQMYKYWENCCTYISQMYLKRETFVCTFKKVMKDLYMLLKVIVHRSPHTPIWQAVTGLIYQKRRYLCISKDVIKGGNTTKYLKICMTQYQLSAIEILCILLKNNKKADGVKIYNFVIHVLLILITQSCWNQFTQMSGGGSL